MSNLIEDLQFLKELQDELNTQDRDSQAAPRFWTVGDYRWIGTPDGNAERYSVYLPIDGEASTIDDYIKNLDLDDLEDDAREAWNELDLGDHSAVFDWIQEHIDEDAYMFGERKEHFIRENTMFLTKAEAKQHIESNHYHYTKEAHTYAMTAWRAPKVEKLLKLLSDCDFNKILSSLPDSTVAL
ncbi:hypothetical protein SAMN02799624_05337 [Paenibacillus sp. UNC496MF]|uniref:hypothetical protein n=1 Tax=Paenibacillus sp. UNC496MF TaxID=1502753 RepID=UPI0008F115FE|nr:hypothetical protein [Paenibacillus sp. UNC496MF]SFJ64370.1 hypothetical protein SAMN02799624_05337 [Paenibacillus sp. UNC496MF]